MPSSASTAARSVTSHFGCGRRPAVGRLDQQPDPAREHVLDVQRALVGDRVRDLGPQVGMPVEQWLRKLLIAPDQLEHLLGE